MFFAQHEFELLVIIFNFLGFHCLSFSNASIFDLLNNQHLIEIVLESQVECLDQRKYYSMLF